MTSDKNCVIIYCFFTAQRRRSICSSSRHFLPPSLWPLNSPDLNPVNYKIWGLLQQRVYSRKIQKVDELQQRIVEEYRIGNAWSSAWSTTHLRSQTVASTSLLMCGCEGRTFRAKCCNVSIWQYLFNCMATLKFHFFVKCDTIFKFICCTSQ